MEIIKRTCLVFLFSITVVYVICAQDDSIYIDLAQLNWEDLNTTTELSTANKVISGSRSERDIADLPFTVYVITGEEILQNGYLTLTDVLKRLPGIRVSQPGSALEGETFLMRGLLGNAYTKILINDVPIRPFITSGMPLGAQLPIREAERIEVIYGPAATLYGADASAGVVNIILKESERPVYVQASLGFGSDQHQNLDVMFSGKIGKGKRILNFSVFGNQTSYDDRQTKYYEQRLYNPRVYQELFEINDFVNYLDSPNYRGQPDTALLGNLPHLSRALGIDLHFGNFHFYSHRFYRRDHSSLGMSTLASSYANPLNYLGESIITSGASYDLHKKRFRFKASTGLINYQTDKNSSATHVLPFLNIYQQSIIENSSSDPLLKDSLIALNHEKYFSGSRYMVASSLEGHLELLLSYKLKKYLEVASGVNIQTGYGTPLRFFLKEPPNIETDAVKLQGLLVRENVYTDFSGFLEAYINTSRWNAILGAQVFTRQNNFSNAEGVFFNPRIAVQYHLENDLRIRLSASGAFRYPSPYYSATSYSVNIDDHNDVVTGGRLKPEKTQSGDVGLRYIPSKKVAWDLSFYYTRTTDFIRFSFEEIQILEAERLRVGYSNDNGSSASIYGLQSSLRLENIIPAIGMSTTFNLNYSVGREFATNSTIGFTDFNELSLNQLRSLPKVIGQVDITLKPTRKITILLENTFMTKSLTQNALLYQVENFEFNRDLENPGFFTLDALLSYKFNKHINAFIKVNNVFNTRYAGLDATSDINALLFNPQPLRYTRVGVNYRID